MFEAYNTTLIALLIILATMLAQTLIAMAAHRRQAHYIPGIVDEKLGHESFVFRSHRTYQNSLENTPLMVACLLVAIFADMAPATLAVISWVYAIARLIHMALYYAIATEKNPSPRSYFFLIGLLANLVLIVMLAAQLITA